jgi:hypothetical protein
VGCPTADWGNGRSVTGKWLRACQVAVFEDGVVGVDVVDLPYWFWPFWASTYLFCGTGTGRRSSTGSQNEKEWMKALEMRVQQGNGTYSRGSKDARCGLRTPLVVSQRSTMGQPKDTNIGLASKASLSRPRDAAFDQTNPVIEL